MAAPFRFLPTLGRGTSVFSLRELARVGAGLSEAALLWTPPAKPLTGDMQPSGGVATIGQPEGG